MENNDGALFHRQGVERRLEIQVAIALHARSNQDLAWRCEQAGQETTPAALEPDGFPDNDLV